MALLQVLNVSRNENGMAAVEKISFTQQRLQKIAIAGETGSGKTTLLKLIAGLIQPTSGEIKFEGKRVEGPLEKLLPGHPQIAYLSQHFELRNNYRVEEELEAKNLLTEIEADTIYNVCRIQHLLKRKTDQLSGGERQRIVLARLLTTSPKLLLLDEPFSNLDAVHKNIIKDVINDISVQMNITCIMVSHDAPDILSWAERILVMKGGQIIQQGTPEDIYRYPVNEYCAGLFGQYNLVNNTIAFSGIAGERNDNKKILIRPEHLKFSKISDKAIQGVVQKILYWGSYYTIDVLIERQVVGIKTKYNHFTSGEIIYITFSPDDVWFL